MNALDKCYARISDMFKKKNRMSIIHTLICCLIVGCNQMGTSTASSSVTLSQAPAFSAKTDMNKIVNLSDYKGKIVVLEWTNAGCPFVKKHYLQSTNLQNLQKQYTSKGVIWLRIISSAKGRQGYVTAEQSRAWSKEHDVHATATILDPTGKLGKLYKAKTTPEFYIVNKKGQLVYQGAIDNKPSTDAQDIKISKNYVQLVLNELLAGKKVTINQTRPYGCGIKYGS